MLKNIYEIISGQTNGMCIELVLIVICWLMMVLAVLIDLWAGVSRAKKCGEKLKSNKFRRTVNKISEYWSVMLFGLFIDVFLFAIIPYYVPLGSFIFSIACCGIEAKSVIENLRRKNSAAAEVPSAVLQILKHIDNPEKLSQYIEILNKINKKHEDNE